MATKDKLLANAQKFLSKGQIAKAIGEYRKLVDMNPKDVRNRQKLAELLSREKKNEEALTEYEAVARHYTETGFYLKAIAVFKQMQKIEPSRVDIYHRLAELNEKQGLVGNALTEYRNLVSFYDKNEMHHEAIEVLEKMAELDPDNLNVSAKIAECYKATGQADEALSKFLDIVKPLSNKGEHTKVVKLYERFLDICPEDDLSRIPLTVALLNTDAADKAIQILKGLLKCSPESPEINKALTDAYVASQDYANARLTLKHLLKQKQKDLDLREYYIRICIDGNEAERARDRLEDWKDDFFAAARVEILQSYYEELKNILNDDQVVSDTLNVIYESVGETSKIVTPDKAGETEDAAVETADEAILDDAIDDVETLDMVGEDVADDVDVPPLADDEETVREGTKATSLELDLDLDLEAPVAGSEESVVEEAAEEAAEVESEDVEVEVEIDLDDMGGLDLEFEEEPSEDAPDPGSEEQVDESQEIKDDIEETDVEEPQLDAEFSPDGKMELGLEDDIATNAAEEPATEPEDGSVPTLEIDDPELDEAVDEATDEVASTEPDGSELQDEVGEIEEIEELEVVEELEELDEIEEPEDVEKLEELDEIAELDEAEELEDIEELEEIEELEDVPLAADSSESVTDFAAALNVEAELEEAEYYLQQGLYDDAARVVQTLLEYRPDLPELHEKMSEINHGRQSAEQEMESEGFVDILGDIQDDDLLAATDFLDSFGEDDVEEELSQKTVSELDSADTDSHYNLGIAYMEMGLYDDAIVEFDKASGDSGRTIDCLTLIGQCHMEAGETDAAMETFKKGLAEEGLSDEARMTLNFDLGMLYQMNGQLNEALQVFQLVAAQDPSHRDVAELMKNLKHELGEDSDDDDGPQGNRDRVYYV